MSAIAARMVLDLGAVQWQPASLQKYSPDQPRDENGRWTSTDPLLRESEQEGGSYHPDQLTGYDTLPGGKVFVAPYRISAEALADVKQTLPALAAKYGVIAPFHVVVGGGFDRAELAWTAPPAPQSFNASTIALNPEFFGKGGKGDWADVIREDNAHGWSADPSMHGTLVHEFAHVLDADGGYADTLNYARPLSDFNAHPDKQIIGRDVASGYALYNRQERFAEAFTQMEDKPPAQWSGDAKFVAEMMAPVGKFDPSEPRDWHGRWTSDGSDPEFFGSTTDTGGNPLGTPTKITVPANWTDVPAALADLRERYPNTTFSPTLEKNANSPATLQGLAALDRLMAQFPGVKVSNISARDLNGRSAPRDSRGAVAYTQGSKGSGSAIVLNSAYFGPGGGQDWSPNQYGFVVRGTGNPAGTVMHEFGHAYMNSLTDGLPIDPSGDYFLPDAPMKQFEAEIVPAVRSGNILSGYSNSNASEMFAESFTAAVNPDSQQKDHPLAQAMQTLIGNEPRLTTPPDPNAFWDTFNRADLAAPKAAGSPLTAADKARAAIRRAFVQTWLAGRANALRAALAAAGQEPDDPALPDDEFDEDATEEAEAFGYGDDPWMGDTGGLAGIAADYHDMGLPDRAYIDQAVNRAADRFRDVSAGLVGAAVGVAIFNAMAKRLATQANPIYEQGFANGIDDSGEVSRAVWHTTSDKEVCELCTDRDGTTWLGDEPHPYPGEGYYGDVCEGGPNCRCEIWYDLVPDPAAAAADGGTSDGPPLAGQAAAAAIGGAIGSEISQRQDSQNDDSLESWLRDREARHAAQASAQPGADQTGSGDPDDDPDEDPDWRDDYRAAAVPDLRVMSLPDLMQLRVVARGEAATLTVAELAHLRAILKYSPDQPRDDHGRWTSDGGELPFGTVLGPDVDRARIAQWATDPSAAARAWSDGEDCQFRSALLGTAGTASELAAAKNLLEAANSAPPTTYPLWRGIGLTQDPGELLKDLQPGKTVDMNLASWTKSEGVARQFASGSFGTVHGVGPGYSEHYSPHQIMFEVAPGAHAFDATNVIVQGPQYTEHQMAGRFRVDSVEHSDFSVGWKPIGTNTVDTIHLTQIGTLSADQIAAGGAKVAQAEGPARLLPWLERYMDQRMVPPGSALKYSPDQPRDDHGRWTDGGGGADFGMTRAAAMWVLRSWTQIRGYLADPKNYHSNERHVNEWGTWGHRLLDQVAAAPPTTVPIYRGLRADEYLGLKPDVAAAAFRVGNTLDLNLASWTSDRAFAQGFAGLHPDSGYILRLDPGTRAFNLTDGPHSFFGGDFHAAEHEWLTDGRFTVADSHVEHVPNAQDGRDADVTVVTLAQQAAFTSPEQAAGSKAEVARLPISAARFHPWLETAMGQRMAGVQKYSPDQPRDDHGRWTSGGWQDPGDRRAAGLPAGFDSWSLERQSAYFDQTRAADRAWNEQIAHGVAVGAISPEEAERRGWSANAQGPVQPLPDPLYHATTAMDQVLTEGLKTRDELGGKQGLGGGTSDTISLTTDKDLAERIAETQIEAHDVATGKITIDDLLARADAGGFRDMTVGLAQGKPGDPTDGYRQAYERWAKQDWSTGLPRDAAEQVARQGDLGWQPVPGATPFGPNKDQYASWERPMTADERATATFDFYRAFLAAQEQHGGPSDPLFWSPDLNQIRNIDPSQVGVVEAHPIPGAMGVRASGMSEWRTWTGDALTVGAVKAVRPDLRKYSPDQPRDWHGRFTAEGGGDEYVGAFGHEFAEMPIPPDTEIVDPIVKRAIAGWTGSSGLIDNSDMRAALAAGDSGGWSVAGGLIEGPALEDAKALLFAANNAPPTQDHLYRGMPIAKRDYAEFLQEFPGKGTVDLNLSSWTPHASMAAEFANNQWNTASRVTGEGSSVTHTVTLDLLPGAHALDATSAAPSWQQDYEEHLTAGRFEIVDHSHEEFAVGATPSDTETSDYITLRQVGTLEADQIAASGAKVDRATGPARLLPSLEAHMDQRMVPPKGAQEGSKHDA